MHLPDLDYILQTNSRRTVITRILDKNFQDNKTKKLNSTNS